MRMLFMGKIKGLNKQEVAKRISEGKVNLQMCIRDRRISNGKINTVDNKITKSYKQIFLNNTITFFNILNEGPTALITNKH